MGGGPSREEKEHQKRLEEIQRQQAAQQTQYLQLAAAPDPLTERLRQRDMAWLDWSSGKDASGNAVPIDVAKAPGLGPALSLFDRAKAGQQGERMGIGALRMGAHGTNADLANLLTEQRAARREQEAAGGLERAVATREAETTGSILPLASLEQSKRMGLAGLASDAAQDTLGNMSSFVGRSKKRPFWQDVLLAGWSQGAQGASMGLGG